MQNFPVPYPDELIYSLVARAGIRSAITSSKQLLDEVFGDRKVIATIDLPSHLVAISSQLIGTGRFDVQQLIYDHTMFPVYAPFIDETIRVRAMERMENCSKGAVHLMLGAAASIVKTSDIFRICPICIAEQEKEYGESYWSRLWYLPSLPYCPKHGPLSQSSISYHDNRHTFHACSRIQFHPTQYSDNRKTEQLFYLAKRAQELLLLPSQKSPTKRQWSLFYNHLAHDFGYGKGRKQVDNEKMADLVINKVVTPQLAIDLGRDTNWLRSIFRFHRKAFSYLQHLTVWSAFIPDMAVSEIIKEVKTKEKVCSVAPKSYIQAGSKSCEEMRKRWKILISTMPIKTARSFPGGGALYAWLYRNDRDWLLAFNRVNHSQLVVRKTKVDWRARDRVLTKQLLRIIERCDSVIEGPRRSKNFLLKQLEDYGTVSKRLNLLPLLSCALNRYQESIFEFQARRLALTVIKTKQTSEGISRWQLMRSASLSKERILPIVDSLLDWAVSGSKLK